MKIIMTGNVFPMGPHTAYGGERIVYYLIKELAKRGHDVYVFAREGSDFSDTQIKDYIPTPALRNDKDVHFAAVLKYLNENFDVLDGSIYQCNYFGDGWNTDSQVIFGSKYCELTWCVWSHAAFQRKGDHYNVISYSKTLQQDFLSRRVPTVMINYGIPAEIYTPSFGHDNYAVWIGKIEGGKAPHLAIQLALAAGMKIVIMGPPYNTTHFWQMIGPYLNHPDVYWVRGVDDAMKHQIMRRAKVFISSNDNTWKEHFGIVNAEALACGTPIIGFNRIGQDCAIKVDEIIKDGEHGFLLNYQDSNNVQEILDKGVPLLQKIDTIDRKACREQFEQRFTAEIMACRYEWFYEQISSGKKFLMEEIPV